MDDSDPQSFSVIQHDTNGEPAAANLTKRRGVVLSAQLSGSSRYSPYANGSTTSSRPSTSLASASVTDDAESTTNSQQAPQSKGSHKDYDKTQQNAIDWAQKRLVMDGAFMGWIKNQTDEDKAKMDIRVIEIIGHAGAKFDCVLLPSKYLKDFTIGALTKDRRRLTKQTDKLVHLYKLEPPSKMSDKDRKSYMQQRRDEIYNSKVLPKYFLHGIQETPTSIDILLFGNPAVSGAHISHWYNDKRSPLCDEGMRALLSTTTLQMLSATSTATRFVIDRYVDGRPPGSNKGLRYSTAAYSGEQDLILKAMSDSLEKDLHRESFEAYLLDLHHRGLRVLHKMLGLPPPNIPIYIPVKAEELSIPRQIPYAATTLPSSLTLLPLVQASGQAQMLSTPITDDMAFNLWFSGLEDKESEEPQASGSGLNDMPFNLGQYNR
ncbi:hypothetical protein DEU56DRAFT_913076 [Suillus clintonianus]|uniref:uncharacterized protein n=1 Tax=Suillus clintonianus TaxID=1904413 RepID=UPI001B86E202|nr:uncharacterized protein DEU56DRAFT_913076 [Suillus clintonianus]KAG2135986.1 hypothetical protein DEU56DRAFT_913076 [Suillus clintonianus]